VRLLDLLKTEHARRLGAVSAGFDIGGNRLQGDIRQREAGLPIKLG
jgi:hypothetical protein